MQLKKVVFPVAGHGSRFLPATKATPKEMLPVVDKPLIQYAVEEAIDAGFTELIFVTGKTKRGIEDHFDVSLDLNGSNITESKRKLFDAMNHIIPDHVTCIYFRQGEPLGLGHAILQAKPIIGDEPFAVILADDLCDNEGESVLAQMTKLYEKYKCSIVAVEEIAPEDSKKYGVIAGDEIPNQVWNDELENSRHPESNLYRVTDMVEKPEPKDAPSNLAIIGRYILTPDIFDILRETKPGKGGEIQITDALLTQAKQGKVIAYKFKGKRFDCGSVDGFVEATNYFYKKK